VVGLKQEGAIVSDRVAVEGGDDIARLQGLQCQAMEMRTVKCKADD
jgi:hypothetical protein